MRILTNKESRKRCVFGVFLKSLLLRPYEKFYGHCPIELTPGQSVGGIQHANEMADRREVIIIKPLHDALHEERGLQKMYLWLSN